MPLLTGWSAHYVIADKGYNSRTIEKTIEPSGAITVIPLRACLNKPRETDFALYAERYRIEGFFNRLKHYRAVTTHYAKRARNFASLIDLAATMLWMKGMSTAPRACIANS